MDPAHHLPPDQEKARYLLHENSLDNKGYVEMLEGFIAQAVLPYKTSGKALDFGCGPRPVLAELLRRRGFIVDTYDLYFEAGPVLEGQTYDVITATEVFEHLKEPMATLEMLVGLLRPGGIIAIMTLLHRQDIEAFKNWWYPSDPTHVAFYCEKTLGLMARKAGLEFARCDGKNICVMASAPKL
jgi:SAM-dependent methyltransferase